MILGMLAPCVAVAIEPLVTELQVRLAESDGNAVNAYLSANWENKMSQLGRLVRRCDSGAVALSASLLETTNLEALQGHVYNLEIAMAKCPEKVLPIVPIAHITSICAVDAYVETHPHTNINSEIERRTVRIRRAKELADSPAGRVCLEAYASVTRPK